jgi:hypothetical protein
MYQQNTASIYPSTTSPMSVPPPENRLLVPTTLKLPHPDASRRFHPYRLAGETSSGQPTPEGSVLSTRVTESHGSAKERTKKKPTAKPTLSDFDAALRPILQLAKRAYCADLLCNGPVLLARHEKHKRASDAILWSAVELDLETTGNLLLLILISI